MSSDDFRNYLRVFTSSHDATEHEKVIVAMLDSLDLDLEYKKMKREGGLSRILSIFSSFSDTAGEELLNDYELKSLQQVGELTRKYFATGSYDAFAQVIFSLILESYIEYYELDMPLHNDEKIIHAIYAKIPPDIYLQTFLLETLSESTQFNWGRDEVIVVQSLIVLTVCFSDIYAFLTEYDEVEEVAD